MNRIYWELDKISLLTDHLDAAKHSHWMLQLFLSIEDTMDICVADKWVSCKCIIVNKNISHSFSANKKLHFSAIIEPASVIADQLNKKLHDHDYYTLNTDSITKAQQSAKELIENNDILLYHAFIQKLYKALGIKESEKNYDERVSEFLRLIDCCSCNVHSISSFTDRLALSPSRFSHIFREQVGVPLKSYILLHQMETAFTHLLKGKNITEAAMLSGFDSPSHFAAAAKKLMGMPAGLSLKDSEFLKVY